MTDVEISTLLSNLAETAATLNKESDHINTLIEQLGEKLRKLNIGIEVWVEEPELSSVEDEEEVGEVEEGNPIKQDSSYDTQLGFTRLHDTWQLAVRQVLYRRYPDYGSRWDFVRVESDYSRLLDASRSIRIAALAAFPALLKKLQEETEAAVRTIRDAKKLVR